MEALFVLSSVLSNVTIFVIYRSGVLAGMHAFAIESEQCPSPSPQLAYMGLFWETPPVNTHAKTVQHTPKAAIVVINTVYRNMFGISFQAFSISIYYTVADLKWGHFKSATA